MTETIERLLAVHDADSKAIGASGREWLTHGELRELCTKTLAALDGIGIGRGDRIAIVLPNGPEMATAFLTMACGVTTAPLNPGYREEELDFYISDLGAKALVVPREYDGAALRVAQRRSVRVIQLVTDASGPAGRFTLDTSGSAGQAKFADPDDIALILHTSGTTSRPKIVPLTQANIVSSARHIATSLALSPSDRCLNIMPLFHIHGLIAATLASVGAGGSTWCSPGFNALSFFGWLETVRPTWYTAVPTMHQAILSRAARNRKAVNTAPLRFVRSSSASLPPIVMKELEATFEVPIIEAYGMTEASHQMTSNPLPPRPRKAGSVGIEAGPLVRIADAGEARLLETPAVGEIVISGANVTRGYEANEGANRTTFFEADGRRWFRTGDQGYLDSEGYLRITGRLKEIINRGGEKISPLEVDEMLLTHPAIEQAVTFAVPHAKLGEDVGAVVVLRPGASATERDIQEFATSRLSAFKVPRTIMILDEIPKGATGKVQRIGLAARLGLCD